MYTKTLLSALSALALVRAQTDEPYPVPTGTAGIATIEGALVYDGPPVIGYTGPGGNATIQTGNPVATYTANLIVPNFDSATGTTITGSITGAAAANGTGVTLSVSFDNLPDIAEYGPLVYHIHVLPVPADGNCTATTSHLDPTDRGELHACEAPAPQTCQAGDLAGKHGNITATTWTVQYTDLYLSTDPSSAYFFGDKSVAIHSSNATRLACGNFNLVSTSTTNATASSAPSPTITPFEGSASGIKAGGAAAFVGFAAVLAAFML
ncbi:MAG: hypothetical protein MMC33_009296 [Icmadophila ericetorum]|nr:hypothetical protein [Icmadophila ericetorum]